MDFVYGSRKSVVTYFKDQLLVSKCCTSKVPKLKVLTFYLIDMYMILYESHYELRTKKTTK